MGGYHRPRIVTSGLVLCIDAANRRSYPGTGSVWNDLSRANNGTLVNGPTFNSENGGSILFNGVNNYAAFGNPYNPGTAGSLTLEVWVYLTGPFTAYDLEPPTTNLAGIFGGGYFCECTGYGIGVNVLNNNTYQLSFNVRNASNFVQPEIAVGLSRWHHFVGVCDRGSANRSFIYLNGNVAGSTLNTSITGLSLNPSAEFRAGANTFPFFGGCRMSVGRVYNRALTDAEVLQNYNALKGRYQL